VLTEQAHALVDQFAKVLELVGVAIILGGLSWPRRRSSATVRAEGTGDLTILVTGPT
jgi:hypothetical protein